LWQYLTAKMDRRAAYSQPVVDAFSVFVIIALFLLFFALFSIFTNERKYTIKQHVSTVDGNIILFTYLRLPVDYHGENLTMAEVLQRVDFKEPTAAPYSFKGEVEKPTRVFLDYYVQSTGCPIYMIFTADGISQTIQNMPTPQKQCDEYKPYYRAAGFIPRPGGSLVHVQLSAGVES
jgi:hypothetical protein